jgi:hypothetical protein
VEKGAPIFGINFGSQVFVPIASFCDPSAVRNHNFDIAVKAPNHDHGRCGRA